ncbi:DUF917 domain-containing protein [Flavisphingomonas formosensis]|uniref:DUF917 domain-containing protein n=1 Tax=Flavisphingomonas formosensis TaxID=861534 RepID=UPI0012FC548E|nr:DUF917 domain-containing protein [Sphingomonas formosensis]
MIKIDNATDIKDIARGAVLLGTGGGGDPYVGELFLQAQLKKGNAPRVVRLEDAPDDALVITIAGIGSPSVMLEHLASEKTLLEILRRAERLYGRPVDMLISCEIGGVNSMFPLALSAISGLPVLDGDGVGRAIPRTEMSTFSIYGCPATPGLILDESGNSVVIETVNDLDAEKVVRAVTSALGASVFGAFYPMTGAEVKRVAVNGTLTKSQEIGRCIREAREGSLDVFDTLLGHLNQDGRFATILFDGKIVDVTHETRGGWHWGRATLKPLSDADDVFTVDIQNEFTVARRNGETVTIVPDLITILDRESGEPITAERLAYGQRVKVIGYSADPLLRTPEGLCVIGPRNFGIDEDYRSIEELTKS